MHHGSAAAAIKAKQVKDALQRATAAKAKQMKDAQHATDADKARQVRAALQRRRDK